jgi:hypothetical protein
MPRVSDRPDPERVTSRADALLPEEENAGSANPTAQAEAILEESEERTLDRDAAPGHVTVEHRSTEDTVEPTD